MIEINDSELEEFIYKYPTFNPIKILRYHMEIIKSLYNEKDSSMETDLEKILHQSESKITNNLQVMISKYFEDYMTITKKESEDIKSDLKLKLYELQDNLKTIEIHELKPNERINEIYYNQKEATNALVDIKESLKNNYNNNENNKINELYYTQQVSQDVLTNIQEKLKPFDTLSEQISNNLKDSIIPMAANIQEINVNLKEYLEKLKNPSKRGSNTEKIFTQLLENIFPKSEIIQVASRDQKGRMDINLITFDKQPILFDLKDYKTTVPKGEIEKFERDILLSNKHGKHF